MDSKELFQSLHNALTEELLQRILSGEAKPADLAVARQFLKDNGIDALATPDSGLRQLVDSLPFDEIDDDRAKH